MKIQNSNSCRRIHIEMYKLYICHSWSLFVNIDINVYSRLCHVVSESLYDDDDILLLSTVSHYFVT